MVKITQSQKKLILKEVHCTHYLSEVRGSYWLRQNTNDKKWYFYTRNNDKSEEIATINSHSHKYNLKYELKKMNFVGVMVKISQIPLATSLGIYLTNSSCHKPTKKNIFLINVATVYFRNGCKRLVPLECIKESNEFFNGMKTKNKIESIKYFVETETSKNKISIYQDGCISIENTFSYFDLDNYTIIQKNRYLFLDIKSRISFSDAEENNEWFQITDEEYLQIMNILKDKIKTECGFIPTISYGENNYDKLVNYTNFPFSPQLNLFSKMFNRESKKVLQKLKYNPECVKNFIQYCGIPYSPRINKIFLKGHLFFAKWLGIWNAGFRDEKIIDNIFQSDHNDLFLDYILYDSTFNKIGLIETSSNIFILEIVDLLLHYYNEKKVGKLICETFCENVGYLYTDTFRYMKILLEENNIPQNVIDKIGKEGFTEYNHDLLMRIYRNTHQTEEKKFENIDIIYTEKEKNLEWVNSGYKFCLPENTNRLVDIGSKMNICVGHLYRDKAVNKDCTIIYAIKNDEYKLCIEVSNINNRFQIIQKSAFNNTVPKGESLKIFEQWCLSKGVVNSKL